MNKAHRAQSISAVTETVVEYSKQMADVGEDEQDSLVPSEQLHDKSRLECLRQRLDETHHEQVGQKRCSDHAWSEPSAKQMYDSAVKSGLYITNDASNKKELDLLSRIVKDHAGKMLKTMQQLTKIELSFCEYKIGESGGDLLHVPVLQDFELERLFPFDVIEALHVSTIELAAGLTEALKDPAPLAAVAACLIDGFSDNGR